MKIRFFAALLLAALSVTIFTGCAAQARQIEIMEEKLENRLDAAEEEIRDALVPAAPAPAAPTVPAAAPTETNLITKEEAVAIALADAGFTEDQVKRLRTEFDRDDGQPEYEVDFHRDGYEYDYEIHAETGAILSKDIDRED